MDPNWHKKTCTKIICVGRNYVEHAYELGNVPPSEPIIFLKPSSSIINNNDNICVPYKCNNLHHEIELGVVIKKSNNGNIILKENAMEYVAGYCLCLDMTARDIQNKLKKSGLPWSISKGFDTASPISTFIDKKYIKNYKNIKIKLNVNNNNDIRQETKCDLMIFDICHLLNYISKYFTLNRGDIIMTGTPKGVSQVFEGDVLYSQLLYNNKQIINMTNRVVTRMSKL